MFTGDIIGCGYACRHCWSSYGLSGRERARWFSADEAANRLLDGCLQNNRVLARLSHGEPLIYPEHVIAVADRFLEMRPDGKYVFLVETNGSTAVKWIIDALEAVAERHESEAEGTSLYVRFSLKALDEANYVWLTGKGDAFYQKVYDNFWYALEQKKYLGVVCSLVEDCIADDEQYEAFLEMLDTAAPGAARYVDLEQLKVYRKKPTELDLYMDERRRRAMVREGDDPDVMENPEAFMHGND